MYRLILFRLMESYFRHRKLYLLPVVVLLACGAAYLVISKPQYSAQGILYIQKSTYLSQLTDTQNSNTSSWWTTPAQDTVSELSELIQTDAFIRAVIQETSLESEMNQGPQVVADTIAEVRKNVWATPQGNSQVLFAASYESPQVAIELVNGMINSYIRWSSNGKRTDNQLALSFFNDLIAKYKAELEQTREAMRVYLESHPDPLRGERSSLEVMEMDRLQSDIDQAQTRYSNALGKEEEARLSMVQIESNTQQRYIVIDAPHVPESGMPSKRDMALKLAIFGMVGVMFSAMAIVGSALFDHTLLVPADVQQQLSLPLLAIVPDASPRQGYREGQARPAKQKASKQMSGLRIPFLRKMTSAGIPSDRTEQ